MAVSAAVVFALDLCDEGLQETRDYLKSLPMDEDTEIFASVRLLPLAPYSVSQVRVAEEP